MRRLAQFVGCRIQASQHCAPRMNRTDALLNETISPRPLARNGRPHHARGLPEFHSACRGQRTRPEGTRTARRICEKLTASSRKAGLRRKEKRARTPLTSLRALARKGPSVFDRTIGSVVVSFARNGRAQAKSFPRKRESRPQAIGNAPPTDWIPAFAGMTGASKAMRFQLTPLSLARGALGWKREIRVE